MLFFKSLIDEDIYEGDVIYSGGTVEYTGEVVHNGMYYCVEKAIVSLGKYSFIGYMKRFNGGNAVLCRYKLRDDDNNVRQYRGIAKTLRLNDIEDDAIFVFRAIREYMLFILTILMIVFFVGLGKCVDSLVFYGRGLSAIVMGLLFVVAFFIMRYLKYLCKIRLPYGYVPHPEVLEIFRANHRPFEVSDLEDEE